VLRGILAVVFDFDPAAIGLDGVWFPQHQLSPSFVILGMANGWDRWGQASGLLANYIWLLVLRMFLVGSAFHKIMRDMDVALS